MVSYMTKPGSGNLVGHDDKDEDDNDDNDDDNEPVNLLSVNNHRSAPDIPHLTSLLVERDLKHLCFVYSLTFKKFII